MKNPTFRSTEKSIRVSNQPTRHFAFRKITTFVLLYSIVLHGLIVAVPRVDPLPKARQNNSSENLGVAAAIAAPESSETGAADNTVTAFNSKRFTRTKGAPNHYVETFTMPGECSGGNYKIVIKNGEQEGTYRISSAEIVLNGQTIFVESDFNQNIYQLEKPVTLASQNTLEIKLASPPNSYLTIDVSGENCGPTDTTPPHLVITSPEDNKATTDPTTAIGGTAEDLGDGASGIAQVLVNNAAVSYDPTTKIWVINSFPLNVGTNVVTARAIDNAGNESTSQVTIIRDLTPPTISISSPADGSITLDTTATVAGVASDGGTDASGIARVTVNGTDATLDLVSGNWNLAELSLAVGTNTVTTTASDRAGNQTSSQVTLTRVVNQPPAVSAGADQMIELPALANLIGSATDDGYPFGSSVSVSWSKISGDGNVTFSNPNDFHTTAEFSTQGVYILRLCATDGQLSSSDDVTVTVQPINQAPVVNAGSNQTVELPNSVNLVGTASDDGYPIDSNLSVTWSKVSGSGDVAFSDQHNLTPTATFSSPGTYVLQLTATDGQLSTVSSVEITAEPENHAPSIDAGANQSIELSTAASLSATASDDGLPQESNLAFSWSKISGPGEVVFSNPSSIRSTATFSTPGMYVLQISASDSRLTSSDSLTITVYPENQSPVVNAGSDQTVVLPNIAALGGTVSDDGQPAGSTLATVWSLVSGDGTAIFSDPNSLQTNVSFDTVGTYVLRLTGSDGSLIRSDEVVVSVTFPNQAPVVNAGGDLNVTQSDSVTLSGTVTDDGLPTGSSVVFTWEKVSGTGDAAFSDIHSFSPTVTFSQAGSYVLKLTATDGDLSTNDEVAITVAPQIPEICQDSNSGTDFWIAFPSAFLFHSRTMDILITSKTSTSGTVSVPGMNLNFSFNVIPGVPTTVRIPNNVGLTQYDSSESKGIHIVAQNEISVSQLDYSPASSDNSLALPVQMLGNSYLVLANEGTSQFAIVAPSDQTSITITPSTAIGSHPAGLPFTKILNRGQTYQLSSGSSSGTILNSDKAIAVFAGATCANVPVGSSACNVLIEQLMPTDMAGTAFVTIPFATRIGDTFRFLATQNQTEVRVNNAVVATLNNGQSTSLILKDPTYITSTKPIFVNQLSNGNSFDVFPGNGVGSYGDPSMVVIPPFDKFLSDYDLAVPEYGFMEHFLNIVAPVAARGGVQIDGSTIPAADFVPIGNSGFVGTQIEVSEGYHHLESDFPFGVINYGFSSFDARSSSGGFGKRKACTQNDSAPPQIIIETPAGGESISKALVEVTGFVGDQNSVTVMVNGVWAAVKENRFSASVPLVAGSNSIQVVASDVFGNTTSSAVSVFSIGSNSNQPPVIFAGPKQTTRLPFEIGLNPLVYDENPSGLTYTWSKVSGPGSINFQNIHAAKTKATASVAGTYVLRLTASDTEYTVFDETTAEVFPDFKADLGPNQTITLPNAASLNLSSLTYDTEIPNNQPFFYLWTQRSGSGTVTFANRTQPSTTATFSAPGLYEIWLSVSMTEDSTITGKVFVTVNPSPINQSPIVNAGNDQTITLPNPAFLNGTVTDDGLPSNSLTVSWSKTSGPGNVTFVNPNSAQTQATFSSPGSYVLRLTANDGQATVTDEVSVTVKPENHPPLVQLGADKTITASQTAVFEAVSIQDDGVPASATYTYQWSKVSGPGDVSFMTPDQTGTYATFSQTGTYVVRLTVSDSELTGSDDMIVTVVEDQPAPIIGILTPLDGATVTEPTTFTGNISDGSWKLEYSLTDTDDPTKRVWTTFASGTGPANGSLGSLDTTLMLNGLYDIRLTAEDQFGQESTDLITVSVERNLKIGNFTVSFDDMNVPVAGIPIQVIRTYDSRDTRKRDFGIGWTLGIKNVRVEKNNVLGLKWFQTRSDTFIPTYCVEALRPHLVTVTMPDGKVNRFEARLDRQCQQAGPITQAHLIFTPQTGTQGTLSVDGDNTLFVAGSVPGPVDLIAADSSGIFDNTVFKYTSKDGTEFTVEQGSGLQSLKDTNGNTVTVSANGITHSSGKSISFTRDALGRITQITDPDGVSNVYTYDENGDLTAYKDRENNTTTFNYEPTIPHHLRSIVDPLNRTPIRNEYDASSRLLKHIDANGEEIVYTHDLAASAEIVRDRLNNETRYEYDSHGNVLKKRDALGNETTYSYDANDNVLTETNALGKTTTSTYDLFDNRTSVTDPLNHRTEFTYNSQGKVLTVKDARNHVTTNTYDNAGNLLTTKDALGNTTVNTFSAQDGSLLSTKDALNNLTHFDYFNGFLKKETDALGNETNFSYDANGNRSLQTVQRTNAQGQVETIATSFEYDDLNRLTKTTFADGSFTQTEYNDLGQQKATIDQAGNRTEFEYDTLGRQIKTTYADGKFEESTYDAEGRRLTSKDRAGHITAYEYDALGHLKKTTYADGTFTTTNYDAIGQVLNSTDARGNPTAYTYDDAGHRLTVKNALNQITEFTYDANGNQLTLKDALDHTTGYVYDDLNRRTRTNFADSTFTETTFDELGRRIAEKDQAGKITQFVYDPLGRLTKVKDALNQETRYEYNEVGQQTKQIDALNRETRYEYDQLGRRTKRILPLGQTEPYTYGNSGNLDSKTDFNGKMTTFAYDSMRRLLSKTPDASLNQPSVSFTYNDLGQRATMTDASGVTNYVYDVRNRLESKQTPFGTLGYTYDDTGNIQTLRSSNTNGVSVDYSYDELNRLQTIKDNRLTGSQTTNYTYDAAGNLQSYTYPNQVTSSYAYNTVNRLTTMTVSNGATNQASYTYTLGAAGNRTQVVEQGGRTVNYVYDDLYRLTSETIANSANNGSIAYQYDPVGNRLERSSTVSAVPNQASTYDANDRLNSDTYDANGNTTASNGKTYNYDFENKLTATSDGVTIRYDGDGNRVAKTAGGVTTNYLVDTNNLTGYAQVVEELQNGQVTKQYTYGHDLISQRCSQLTANCTLSFYSYDGHGSVRQLTDAAASVTDTYSYDAFGTLIERTGSTDNNYLYAGEQFDPDLGLYYNRARYLNAQTGRFVSMDSHEGASSNPESLHKYFYANNNPVNLNDPSGHISSEELVGTLPASQTIAAIPATQGAAILDAIIVTTENRILLSAILEGAMAGGEVATTAEAAASFSIADAFIQIYPLITVDALIEVGYIASLGRRLPATNGHWTGPEGNSDWVSDRADVNEATGNQPIPFRNGYPDFSQWSRGQVTLPNMTGLENDIDEADKILAQQRGWLFRGEPNASAARRFRSQQHLTWHHVEDGHTMMLVPRVINGYIPHIGGASQSRNNGK